MIVMSVITSFVNVIAGASVLLGGKAFMDEKITADGPSIRKVVGVPLLGVGALGILVSYVRNKRVREDKKAESDFYEAELYDADYDLSDKDDRIDELRNQIRYLEQSMEIAGYGSRDVRHLHSLENELAELQGLQEFDFAFEIHNKKTGELIEDGVITIDGFSEEDAKAKALQALEEGRLDDEEITFDW